MPELDAAKAYAGGAAAALSSVILYFLDFWWVIKAMPPEIHTALGVVVSAAITGVTVYHVPNRPKES